MIRVIPAQWLNVQQLANHPPVLSDAAILLWSLNGTLSQNAIAHLKSYLTMRPVVSWGPYEIHPYVDRYSSQFDLTRESLILGTFPPNYYLRDIAPLTVAAANHPDVLQGQTDFYYGNQGSLWYYLGLGQLPAATDIISYLVKSSVSISDVVLGTQRSKFSSPADSALLNILPNHFLCNVFSKESNIKTILLTSGSLRAVRFLQNGRIRFNGSDINTTSVFLEILLNVCAGKDSEISGTIDGSGPFFPINVTGLAQAEKQQYSRVQNNQVVVDANRGIIWYIKVGEEIYRIINLPNPANSISIPASDFFYRWLRYKAIISELPVPPDENRMQYINQYPDIFTLPITTQYRSEVYQLALTDVQHLMKI